MRDPDKNIHQQEEKRTEEDMLPPTEIAKNPNPRANENIRERTAPDGQMEKKIVWCWQRSNGWRGRMMTLRIVRACMAYRAG